MQNEELGRLIGRRVKRFRSLGSMSQEKLARAANVSTASVNSIENGKANPTLEILSRLAVALGVSVGTLTKSVEL